MTETGLVRRLRLHVTAIYCFGVVGLTTTASAAQLPDIIDAIRPSIVGVGTFQPTRRPPNHLLGTGFVVGDGTLVATNAHVIPLSMDDDRRERLVVYVGRGEKPDVRSAVVVKTSPKYDLALLRISGTRLSPLNLGNSAAVREGQEIAFTGFPIGAVLGLYPVTHRGIVSSITPIAIPATSSAQLTPHQVAMLRSPFEVFQLDGTAYPGNSGSPVYDQASGEVVGIINQVLVKDTKENILAEPSAISYAIPIRYLRELLSEPAAGQH